MLKEDCNTLIKLDGKHALDMLIKVWVSTKGTFLAQVSYSDHCPSSINFSFKWLLLQNYWTDFNQIWKEASLGNGDSTLQKSRDWHLLEHH